MELLSPAGDHESAIGALNAGADAVYVGAQKFSARAFADNPSNEDICAALDYAHIFGKKIYLALNTLIKDSEIADALEVIRPLYEYGLDGIIVQDLGLIKVIPKFFPKLALHGSTQMAVSSMYGARRLKDMGIERVVLSRELSIDEIKAIVDDGKEYGYEVECFVHGAMCYSYSGCCLFSSIAGGRSGNRGRCAGPCRKPYEVFKSYPEATKGKKGNDFYPLSMRDMCTVEYIDELYSAGIDSLKIEGRMKSPEYAAGVSKIYKSALTKCIDNTITAKDKKIYEKELRSIYIRANAGTGYLHEQNGRDMLTLDNPAYNSSGDVSESDIKKEIRERYIKANMKMNVNLDMTLLCGTPLSLTASAGGEKVVLTGSDCEYAENEPISDENLIKQLSKTGQTLFKADKINISNDNISFVSIAAINGIRRQALAELHDKLALKYHRENVADVTEKVTELMKVTEGIKDNARDSGDLFEYRISTAEQLRAYLDVMPGGDISSDVFSEIFEDKLFDWFMESGKKITLVLPEIIREKNRNIVKNRLKVLIDKCGNAVKGIEALGFDGLYLADDYKDKYDISVSGSVYVFNMFSEKLLDEDGYVYTASYEKNKKELTRPGYCRRKISLYGYIPLMYTANCILKTCFKCSGNKAPDEIIYLKDESGRIFPVSTVHRLCHNIIYNNVPMSLINKADEFYGKYERFSVNFTIEDYSVTLRLIKFLSDISLDEKEGINSLHMVKLFDENGFTTGHYKRGVE